MLASVRALSSAGERSLHTGEVAGSIPAAPTIDPVKPGSRSPRELETLRDPALARSHAKKIRRLNMTASAADQHREIFSLRRGCNARLTKSAAENLSANTAIANQCFRSYGSSSARGTTGRLFRPSDPTNRYCTLHERTSSLRPTVHFGRSLFALAAGFLRRRSLARAS